MVHVKKIQIGGNAPIVLIAGPCVVESEKITLNSAEEINSDEKWMELLKSYKILVWKLCKDKNGVEYAIPFAEHKDYGVGWETTIAIKRENFAKLKYQSISHPNESEYLIKDVTNSQKASIVLSQSFNSGWKAYGVNKLNFVSEIFPFAFGKEIKQHILVNNWENGWILEPKNDNRNIIIIYLPQYLGRFI